MIFCNSEISPIRFMYFWYFAIQLSSEYILTCFYLAKEKVFSSSWPLSLDEYFSVFLVLRKQNFTIRHICVVYLHSIYLAFWPCWYIDKMNECTKEFFPQHKSSRSNHLVETGQNLPKSINFVRHQVFSQYSSPNICQWQGHHHFSQIVFKKPNQIALLFF